MVTESIWFEVEKVIEKNHTFILTTHIIPDGDGIGSELALYEFLRSKGKEVTIINPTITPNMYKFLDPEERLIKIYSEKYRKQVIESDVIIFLDISTSSRLGKMSSIVEESNAQKIYFDHHISNGSISNVGLIDEDACATGEIIYDLIHRVRTNIDSKIAEYLYIAILTDTGSFRFSNSTPQCHIIAAELLKTGINPRKIYMKVYEHNTWEQAWLFGATLNSIERKLDGKVAVATLWQKDFERTGAKRDDVEGFVDCLDTINGVEGSVLLLELPTQKVKVSLRSKRDIDVNKIAAKFNGGGHMHAAGIQMEKKTIEEVKTLVLEEIDNNLKSAV